MGAESSVTITYQRQADLVWRWFRGSVIVLGASDRYQTLGGGAALVWSLLEHPMSKAEIAAAAVRYGVASAVPGADLDGFVHAAVEMLLTEALITSSKGQR